MATKMRMGMRCYKKYVPTEVWDVFKKDLRKIVTLAFPDQKFSVTEYYWEGFSVADEYIRIRAKSEGVVDWKRMWRVLDFVAREFGMQVKFVYQEIPVFCAKREDDLFERKYSNYSLISNRTWTENELDDFLADHSIEKVKAKYDEAAI